MQLIISARKFNLRDDVRDYVQEKMEKMNNFFDNIVSIRVELSREEKRDDGKPFGCEVLVSVPNKQFRAEKRGGELFEAIDLTEEALEVQIKSFKEKIDETMIKDKGQMNEVLQEAEQASLDEMEEDQFDYIYRGPGEAMTLDEAKQQMELLKQDFYVFINEETGKTNTVYKKADGRYGVIVEG